MRYPIESVKKLGVEILLRAGLRKEHAELCVDCLSVADARGVHSHGILHLKDICARIEAGTVAVTPEIRMEQTAPGAVTVDAGGAVGMVPALYAMEQCVKLAGETGIAAATVRGGNTYGYGAYYPMYAAEHGMIGIAVCNTKAYVAPWGGSVPTLGTNPLSIAIPAEKHPNLVLDMSTSQAAVNKIALAIREGRSIPEDWAVGPNGERTADPALAWQGALLPFGGYKGYGIQLVISLLACALAGGAMDRDIPRAWADADQPCNFGCFLTAINIERFMPLDQFKRRVDEQLTQVKNAGAGEILIPGERGYREYRRSLAEGTELSDAVVCDLERLSVQYGAKEWFQAMLNAQA